MLKQCIIEYKGDIVKRIILNLKAVLSFFAELCDEALLLSHVYFAVKTGNILLAS